eukprot:Sspe_Gene.53819::Locus_29716_Transcript_1_1_Confidence_1.000_Length_1994::g.53819::m.53819
MVRCIHLLTWDRGDGGVDGLRKSALCPRPRIHTSNRLPVGRRPQRGGISGWGHGAGWRREGRVDPDAPCGGHRGLVIDVPRRGCFTTQEGDRCADGGEGAATVVLRDDEDGTPPNVDNRLNVGQQTGHGTLVRLQHPGDKDTDSTTLSLSSIPHVTSFFPGLLGQLGLRLHRTLPLCNVCILSEKLLPLGLVPCILCGTTPVLHCQSRLLVSKKRSALGNLVFAVCYHLLAFQHLVELQCRLTDQLLPHLDLLLSRTQVPLHATQQSLPLLHPLQPVEHLLHLDSYLRFLCTEAVGGHLCVHSRLTPPFEVVLHLAQPLFPPVQVPRLVLQFVLPPAHLLISATHLRLQPPRLVGELLPLPQYVLEHAVLTGGGTVHALLLLLKLGVTGGSLRIQPIRSS